LLAAPLLSKMLCAPLAAIALLLIRIVIAQNLQRRFCNRATALRTVAGAG